MSSEWPTVQLSDCAEFQEGYVNPSQRNSDFFDGPIKWLRAVDLNDSVVSDTTRTLSEKGFRSAGKSALLFEPGSLAISKSGTIGRLGILEDYMCGNRAVINIRVNHSICDKHYIFYVLKSKRAEIESLATGSVQKNLYTSVLGSMELDLPPLETQKAIASQLWALDKKIQHNHQINQTLEQMAQAIFKSWFVDFEPVKAKIAALEAGGSEDDALLAAMQAIAGSALFATDAADADAPTQLARLQAEHPEQYATLRATAELFPSAMQESELGEIPEGWEASTLSDFCEFQNGYAFKGKDWADSGFPVVKIGSVKPGFVDLTKVSYVSSETVAGLERFELKAGDILVGMTGYPGETGLVPNYADRVFLNQRVGRFIPNEKYLYAYIFSAVRDSEFKVFVESQAHGSAQANISGKAILQYPLISGSKNLMMRFYEVVNPQIQQMICLNAESSQLGELRDTLLPKLLSGEITLAEEVKRS